MNYIIYFFIFSLFGWILETVYASMIHKKFVSKQTLLKSPLCPIYGLGAIAMMITLKPISQSWLLLFCGGFFVAGSVEYLIAIFYEHYFNVAWWDYRNNRANLNGKVCVRFSVIWGVTAIAFFEVILPWTEQFVSQIDGYLKLISGICLVFFFAHDYTATLKEVKKFSREESSKASEKFECLKVIKYE